eukprot:m51a1_g8408 hypothetical protein (261) ;mRNA; f:259537-260962
MCDAAATRRCATAATRSATVLAPPTARSSDGADALPGRRRPRVDGDDDVLAARVAVQHHGQARGGGGEQRRRDAVWTGTRTECVALLAEMDEVSRLRAELAAERARRQEAERREQIRLLEAFPAEVQFSHPTTQRRCIVSGTRGQLHHIVPLALSGQEIYTKALEFIRSEQLPFMEDANWPGYMIREGPLICLAFEIHSALHNGSATFDQLPGPRGMYVDVRLRWLEGPVKSLATVIRNVPSAVATLMCMNLAAKTQCMT